MESLQEEAKRLTANIGTLVNVYEFRNADGTLVFCNLRIMQSNGQKTFRMMAEIDGAVVLRRPEKPEKGWPLYGLASLSTSRPTFLVEGERDVDSLHAIGLAALTSGGTNTARNADWSPLAGRNVIIWPDNDTAGQKYADEGQTELEDIGCNVERVNVEMLGLPEKGDCSDWLALHPTAGADEVLKLDRVKKIASGASYDLPRAVIVRGKAWATTAGGLGTGSPLRPAGYYSLLQGDGRPRTCGAHYRLSRLRCTGPRGACDR